jgi:hypothetical protein
MNDCCRSALLERLHRSISHHTRFFAAAALTNPVLAGLCSRRAGCLTVSQAIGQFLHDFSALMLTVRSASNTGRRALRISISRWLTANRWKCSRGWIACSGGTPQPTKRMGAPPLSDIQTIHTLCPGVRLIAKAHHFSSSRIYTAGYWPWKSSQFQACPALLLDQQGNGAVGSKSFMNKAFSPLRICSTAP